MFKKYLSLIIAFFLVFSVFVPVGFVSAESQYKYGLTSEHTYSYMMPSRQENYNLYKAFFENSTVQGSKFSMHSNDTIVAFYTVDDMNYIFAVKSTYFYSISGDTQKYVCNGFDSSHYFNRAVVTYSTRTALTPDFVRTINFQGSVQSFVGGSGVGIVFDTSDNTIKPYGYRSTSSRDFTVFNLNYTSCFCAYDYVYIYDPLLFPLVEMPLNLDIQEQSFAEWLVSSGHIADIPYTVTTNNLSQLISYFAQYGSSASLFIEHFPEFALETGLPNAEKSVLSVTLNKLRSLYQQYLNEKNAIVADVLVRYDDNYNLTVPDTVVNDDNTSDLFLLRALLTLNNNMCYYLDIISDKIDSLDFTTNIVNDNSYMFNSGSIENNETYNNFLTTLNQKTSFSDDIENLDTNLFADLQETNSLTVPFIVPEFQNGKFVSKQASYTIDENSKLYEYIQIFKDLFSFFAIIFFCLRLKNNLPSLIHSDDN